MDVAIIGGVPYGEGATILYPSLIESINADPQVRRVFHVGDIKSDSTLCSDDWFTYIRDSFDQFDDPVIYTPGDNEWTDCHRTNSGAYNPMERLARLREVFFEQPGLTQGALRMQVKSQARYPENQLWMESRVVFVAIHLVGSNNNLAPWTGETSAMKAEREAEWSARDVANRAWLSLAYDLAEHTGAVGVVVVAHGDMWNPGDVAAGSSFSGHRVLVELLARRAADFGRPVILLAGDSHRYRVDRPLIDDAVYNLPFDVPNLTQITVQQSIVDTRMTWVRLTIDPRDSKVFSWEEVEAAGKAPRSDQVFEHPRLRM